MVAGLAPASFAHLGWAADDADIVASLKCMSLKALRAPRVDTVVGASKREQKVTEAPSAVSIAIADGIRKQGYCTLADGFVVANATLFSRELVKGLEVSASVYNLFDQRYHDPCPPISPRTLSSRTGAPSA
jgi:outer membrane receptor protein involved in Fe transport